MKTTTAYAQPSFMARPIVPLPNVVTRRQFFRKVLDTALVIVSSIGIAVMLLFFLALA